jgi:TonB family protein
MRCAIIGAAGLVACTVVAAAGQNLFVPAARYRNGPLPQIPIRAVGGGEVLLELSVSSSGVVTATRPLQTTPLFTEALSAVVGGWQFVPAEEAGKPVESKVLVAGLFRPPSIYTPTLGELPRDVAVASPEAPYPTMTVTPPYPPLALQSGVVLVEAQVDARGDVVDAEVARSAPPFDAPALESARQWKFRPARINGVAVPTYAYIVFAFRQPVTGPGVGGPDFPPPPEPIKPAGPTGKP